LTGGTRSVASGHDEAWPFGAYYLVLFALGLEKDLLAVAQDDVLGRRLQDLKLLVRKRAPKTKRKTVS
jgi:hypothetical protein